MLDTTKPINTGNKQQMYQPNIIGNLPDQEVEKRLNESIEKIRQMNASKQKSKVSNTRSFIQCDEAFETPM